MFCRRPRARKLRSKRKRHFLKMAEPARARLSFFGVDTENLCVREILQLGGTVGAFVLLAYLIRLFFQRTGLTPSAGRVQAVIALCTPHEQKLFHALRLQLDSRYHLCAKVRLIDILKPQSPTDKATFSRLVAKHIDFLVIDAETTHPVLAIELDDRSHEAPARQTRDQFVNAAFQQAGVPLLRGSLKSILASESWLRVSPAANEIAGRHQAGR